MSDIVTCTGCGGIFRGLLRGRCAECVEQRERDYEVVRDHLREHPSERLAATADATGVKTTTIEEFVADGRLQFADGEGGADAERERRTALAEQLAARAQRSAQPEAPPRGPSPAHGMATRKTVR